MNYSPEMMAWASQKPFLQSGEWRCLGGAEFWWPYRLGDVSLNSSTSVSQSLSTGTKSESPLSAYRLKCNWLQTPGSKFKPYHSEQDCLEGWARSHAKTKAAQQKADMGHFLLLLYCRGPWLLKRSQIPMGKAARGLTGANGICKRVEQRIPFQALRGFTCNTQKHRRAKHAVRETVRPVSFLYWNAMTGSINKTSSLGSNFPIITGWGS